MKFIICISLVYIVAQSQSNVNCRFISLYNRQNDFESDSDNEITHEVPLDHSGEQLIGAPRVIDKKDEFVNDLLSQHLGRLITGDDNKFTIAEISEITQQVVAGYLFKVKGNYIVEGQQKQCVISILNQPWISGEKVVISAKCSDGSCYVTDKYICSPDSLYAMHNSRQNRMFLFSA